MVTANEWRGGMEGQEGQITNKHRKLLGTMDIFTVVVVMMVSQIYMYAKTSIVCFKYVEIIVYQLCL